METLIKKAVKAESGEIKALLWSFGYFFFLLSTYYMLLPLRDAMGIEGGTRNLSWLFAATFIATDVLILLACRLYQFLNFRWTIRILLPVLLTSPIVTACVHC